MYYLPELSLRQQYYKTFGEDRGINVIVSVFYLFIYLFPTP